VNLEKDNVRDIWLPAVVVKENEDRTFLVKCQSSWNSDEAGTMKTIVDSLHIRPTPPHAKCKTCEVAYKRSAGKYMCLCELAYMRDKTVHCKMTYEAIQK
jgi:hypothetical protein